jgi:hypothetical protein
MTAASVLPGQISKIEQANATSGTRPDVEVAQAEPVSTYFEAVTLPNSLIAMPPEAYALPARAQSGTLTVQVASTDNPIRGYVSRVDGRNATLPSLDRAFAVERTLHVPWIRLGSPPSTTDAKTIYERLLAQRRIREPRFADGSLALVAITFPDEVTQVRRARTAGSFSRSSALPMERSSRSSAPSASIRRIRRRARPP